MPLAIRPAPLSLTFSCTGKTLTQQAKWTSAACDG